MAKSSIPLTQARLKELLSYDPEMGEFTWLVDRKGCARAGDIAGFIKGSGAPKSKGGYRCIWVDSYRYPAHRLAWLYMTGTWPSAQIDHRNRLRSDNRWSNLREATREQNMINRTFAKVSDLPLGVRVIGKKFGARVRENGVQRHLGVYDTPEEANAAYAAEAKRIHGEFFSD